jgi:type IV pilus assembly protein PilY1
MKSQTATKRTTRILTTLWLVLALAFLPASSVWAGQSDVDLFTGGGRLAPNIMIMLDSSGSMRDPASGGGGNKIDIAKAALATLVTTVNPSDGSGGYIENARFGLFNFRANGGLLRTPIGANNTGAVLAGISSQTAPGGVGTPLSGAALDVARYFNNQEPWGALQLWGKDGSEPAVTSAFDYECRDSFMIYISDGLPNNDALTHSGFFTTIGDTDGDNGSGLGEQDPENNAATVASGTIRWGDDITKAMFDRDFSAAIVGKQNVVSHVIGFDINTPILANMATNGGGNYYTSNSAATLGAALGQATTASFDALASYSTAVVPTSRTQFGSAFYNAFFEPDANDSFWEGHLEAYGISSTGVITDRLGNPAVDPVTDLLYDPHDPHWDAGIVLRSQGTRDIYSNKGGQRVDFSTSNVGTGSSQISTADMGILLSEVGFYPNYPSSGVTSQANVRDAIIEFLHGRDAFDQDGDGIFNELRPKVLGDIFHSTPNIVGPPSTVLMAEAGYAGYYGDYDERDRVIYAGANDGMLHAFDAGSFMTGDDPATPETELVYYTPGYGTERFGFVPGMLLDDVKMVPRNNPRTYYFVDGSPVAADVWLPSSASDVSKEKSEWMTMLLTGYREGGEGYLALDVTEPGAVTGVHGPYPKFLWEFTDPKLGEAWSEPIITRVKVNDGNSGDNCGYNDGDGDCREHWVAIVGGGYDVSSDPNTTSFDGNHLSVGWTDRSKAIFMIDLTTGSVLARVEFDSSTNPDMIYGLPSKPAVLDYDFDGFADVVYIGDLGGQMWKWDIKDVGADSNSDGEVDNWTADVFFRSPAEMVAGPATHYRSFFYPPVAAFVRGKLVLSFASGEREALRYAGDPGGNENNRMYVIRDPYPTGTNAFATTFTEYDLTDVTGKDVDDNPNDYGFFFSGTDGEKFVSELIIFAGYVIAVSYEPAPASADPCLAASGVSTLYAFNLASATGYFRTAFTTPMQGRRQSVGGGLASTPRVSIAPDPSNDKMYVKTSKGKVLTIDPPGRGGSGNTMIYWRQNF